MKRILLTIEYNGKNTCGWQMQAGGASLPARRKIPFHGILAGLEGNRCSLCIGKARQRFSPLKRRCLLIHPFPPAFLLTVKTRSSPMAAHVRHRHDETKSPVREHSLRTKNLERAYRKVPVAPRHRRNKFKPCVRTNFKLGNTLHGLRKQAESLMRFHETNPADNRIQRQKHLRLADAGGRRFASGQTQNSVSRNFGRT